MATTAHGSRRSDYYDDPEFNYAEWWRGREYEHEAEVMAIQRMLEGKRFGYAVDVGGGFGRLSVVLADYADRVTLVDSSIQQLDLSKNFLARHPRVDSRLMMASELGFPDASVDLVTMIRVMHHLPDPAPVFSEVARILRPGGTAIIEAANTLHAVSRLRYMMRGEKIPAAAVDIGSHGDIPYVNHHPETVQGQLQAAGFHVKRRLSVSNLRHPAVKLVMPKRVMLAMENKAQERLAGIHFGPSIFFLLEK
jgi:SAM-dependent methyltransferase